jgi:hypothetical protein
MHHGDATIAVTGRYRPARIRTYLDVLRDIYGPSLPAGLTSWVDIGCGHGEFLAALRAFGAHQMRDTGVVGGPPAVDGGQFRGGSGGR